MIKDGTEVSLIPRDLKAVCLHMNMLGKLGRQDQPFMAVLGQVPSHHSIWSSAGGGHLNSTDRVWERFMVERGS